MAEKTGTKKNIITRARRNTALGVIALAVLIFLGLLFVAGRVQNKIVDSNLRNMEELAAHDELSLRNSLDIRWAELEDAAKSLKKDDFTDDSAICAKLRSINVYVTSADYTMLITDDGTEYRSTGLVAPNAELHNTSSQYDTRFVARYNDNQSKWVEVRKEMLVMGVPVDFDCKDSHFSWFLCRFDINTLEKELKIDSYEGKGFSSVIDRDGNYVVNFSRTHSVGKFDNFFDELEDAKFDGIASIDEFRTTTTTADEIKSLAYTHDGVDNIMVIKALDYADWYFVSTVPKSVFNEQAQSVMKPFIKLLAAVAVITAGFFILILRQRKQSEKLREAELLEKQNEELKEQNMLIQRLASSFERVDLVSFNDNKAKDIAHLLSIGKDGVIEVPGIDREKGFSENLGIFIENVVHPDYRDYVYAATRREEVLKNITEHDEYDVPFRTVWNGERHWYNMSFSALDPEDIMKGMVVGLRKIDAEKASEKALEDALNKAEAANEAKSNFLFSMSHDIRTPMNAITGFTNMAIKHIDDKDKVLDCLDKTKNAGSMLLSLINSVLEVSRIESGHATLDEQPGDVFLSFANISTTMNELAVAKNIDLSFNFLDIRDRYVYADFSRCMRVFVNIISNAIKYTPEGGWVKVTCEQAGTAKDGIGTYRYTIEDNGIGMSEEFQKHVFDQFSREETSTVSGIQGTGLGMSVVKSFVELLGGEITVKSKQGEGSTFTVLLPFRLQEEEKLTDPVTGEVIYAGGHADVEVDDISFFGKKVLLVEDNEMNREIAQDILEENGFIVDTAEDGTIAYDIMIMAKPGDYDLILMDIQMPIMNGYEATSKIRALTSGVEKIPIIALSANAFAEDRKKSLEAGMNDHDSKPINVQELKASLARFL